MKVVGQLVCGPGEAGRWLKLTLEDLQRLCDDVVVAMCNAGPEEWEMVRSFDFRAYEDNREWGRHQHEIKTDLLKRIRQLDPSIIVALDADEMLPTLDRAELERMMDRRDAAQLYVVDLWNDEEHYSKTLSFWNVRVYKPTASSDSQFLRRPLHCGNAPPYFYSKPARESYVPHILLHRGLMREADRLKKAERYAKYDPDAIHKGRDYYDALVAQWSGSEYRQIEVLNKIKNYVSNL